MADTQLLEKPIIEEQQQEPLQEDPPLKKLYNGLHSDGKYTKSFDEFKVKYSNIEERKKLHTGLVGDGDYTKSIEDFNSQYFPEDVKKKNGEVSTNGSFPSTSELYGVKGEVTPQEPLNDIDAVLQSQSKLKATKKESRTSVEKALTIGDTDKTITEEFDVPDTDTNLQGAAEEAMLKQKGIDVDKYKKLFGDIPEDYFNVAGFSKGELSQKMKENPLEAERYIQGNKASFALQDAIDEQQRKDPATDYQPIKNLILDAANNTNFPQRRQDNAAIVKAMDLIPDAEQRQKVKDNFAASQAYVYGQHSEDVQDQQNNPLSDRLNSNQLTALDYIKDVHPELADGFGAAMVNPKDIKGNVDAELGQQEKAKKLEEIGINLKTNYAQEELTKISPRYNELLNITKERELTFPEQQEAQVLETKRQKLVGMMNNAESEIANMTANYPLVARLDADNFAQELLGEKNTGLSHLALTMGKATNNTYDGIVNAVKTPFLSEYEQQIQQAGIIGSGNIDDNITYLGQDKQLMQTFKGKVSKGLQADIDIIKNDKLSTLDQKRDKVQDLLLKRPKEWQRVPIEGGKSNIGLVSMLYGTGDLAANLVPFIALEGITGGGATAGALRKFTSVFASAAATSYQETLRGAIQEGVENPYEKAWRVTTINSLAMAGAGTPAAIRKLAGLQKGLVKDGVMKMTDDEILMALRETPKEFSLLKKAYNIGAKVGTSAVDASKEAVRFGGFTTAGQVANDAIDGKLQSIEHYGKHAAIEALKFAAFGTVMGSVAKLQQGHNETNKATIFEAGRNPEAFTKAVDEKIANGTLSLKEAEEIKANITKAAEVFKKVPMVDAKGKPLSEQGSRDLLILKLQEKDIEETLSKDIPKALFTKMEERLVDVQDKMDKVYKGTFVDANTLSKREALLNTSRDLISKNQVKGFSAIPLKDAAVMDKGELETYLKDVSEQAIDPLSNKSAIDTYGESLVNIAQRLFPKTEEVITEPIEIKNELPIQETVVGEVPLPIKEGGVGGDVESKKADIEKRRKEENKKFPSGETTFKKISPDGENTVVTDKQKTTIERIIEGNIKDGKTPAEIVTILNQAGYVVNYGNETTTLMNYLKDRIEGTNDTPFFEFNHKLRDRINAKYDTELKEVEQSQSTKVSEVPLPIKKVHNNNAEISKVGTDKEYQEYLNTIFPESQIKDVVYHRSDETIDQFDNSKINKETGGLFDFSKTDGNTQYGKNVYPVLLDVKKVGEGFELNDGADGVKNTIMDGSEIYSVPDGKQVYILGSKADIEGFKKWKEQSLPTKEVKTVEQLREQEKAEVAATDPNDKAKLKEIYDRYDAEITPLLEKEKENVPLLNEKGTEVENVTREQEIKTLEKERDNEIDKVSKPDLKLNLVSSRELVNTKDPVGNKEIHDTIKEKYKKLKLLIECL